MAPETHTVRSLARASILCWESYLHHKRWPVNARWCC